MTKNVTLALVTIFTLLFSSCNTSKVNCPNLSASHHNSRPHIQHTAYHKSKSKKQVETAKKETSPNKEQLTASGENVIVLPKKKLMEIKLPSEYTDRINEAGIDNLNSELGKYSKHMRVEQRGNSTFVKVSPREMLKVSRKLIKSSKQDAASTNEPRSKTMEIIALIAGILGIVALPFSLIPFLNIVAFGLSIAAIVMGAISLKQSGKRRKWAIIAIVLGSIALVFAIASFLFYFILFFALLG